MALITCFVFILNFFPFYFILFICDYSLFDANRAFSMFSWFLKFNINVTVAWIIQVGCCTCVLHATLKCMSQCNIATCMVECTIGTCYCKQLLITADRSLQMNEVSQVKLKNHCPVFTCTNVKKQSIRKYGTIQKFWIKNYVTLRGGGGKIGK